MGANNNSRRDGWLVVRSIQSIRRLSALCLAALAVCVASGARADDLVSLYQAATGNDPRYLGAAASYRAVEQRVPQARAGLLPRAQATATRNRNEERTITDSTVVSRPTGNATYSGSEYSVSITQPIFNVSALIGLRQANAELRRAEAEYDAARHDLAVRVAEAYFQLLLAQDTQALALAEKETLARHFDAAQAKKRAGAASIVEVEDARARLEISAAQEVDAANRTDDRRQALREIVGRVPQQIAGLADRIPLLTIDPPDIERWVNTALRQNPGVIAATEAVQAASEDIDRMRADHSPTLDLVGSRNRTDADGSISGPGVQTDSYIVGLQLKVPLLQGGLVYAKTREASYRHDAALQELEARRRNAERTTRASFRDVHGAVARVQSLQQAVIAGETSLEARTQGYRAGVYHTLDVLDATRELFRSKRDYSEARYTHLFSFLRLKQSAGTLNDDDLAQINSWLR